MSTHSNPYTQGGWYGASSFTLGPDSLPSVYGALPMTTNSGSGCSGSRTKGARHFQFANPNPTILNSVVVGPHRDGSVHQLVHISTDERLAGYTAFRDAEGRSVALVEWLGALPRVEVQGAVAKGPACEWLKVVLDPKFGRPVRRMEVRGSKFVWCPNGEALLLYSQSSSSNPLGVVTKNKHVVDLEMSEQALSLGLLEPCIVAVTLMLSARRLE